MIASMNREAATLSDFEALSFDCYGTLIDWESGISAVIGPWAAEHGVALTAEELLERYAAAEAAEEVRTPAALYPDILAATMRSLAESIGVTHDEADSERLARSVPEWPAFADAPKALATLATRYKLIILSNVDRMSFAESNARLGVRFDAIITAQDVGSYKPSRRNFGALLETVDAMGIDRARLLHVAQSLFHDHVPAKAFDLPTVWIDRRAGRPGWGATPPPDVAVTPDWTFASMGDFAAACAGARNG
jgi:2-haloacid dehalogenase